MSEKEYIIFCDESDQEGKYYSNFYGGLIVGASQYQRLTRELNALKDELHFFGEVKWEKVTQNYLAKYQTLIRKFFAEVAKQNVRVRIMFRQNAHQPRGLTDEQVGLTYFQLYYQFIKHGLGLSYIVPTPEGTRLRLYFDQFPDTRENIERFKGFLLGLQKNSDFEKARIILTKEDITEVSSHDHVLLQCLDVILGAMAFRLNDKHKDKPRGQRRRGKRTIAKAALYKTILEEIKKIYPRFNIGISTGTRGDLRNRWLQPYAHWDFKPKGAIHESRLTKRGQKKKRKNPI